MKVGRALAVSWFVLFFSIACGNSHRSFGSGNPPGTGAEFLFVSNQAQNTISAFRIDSSTGALTGVAGSPFPAQASAPGRMAVDPTSHFLFVANQGSATITSYSISGSGLLTSVSTGITGHTPRAVAVHPTLNVVYAVSQSGAVSAFSFDGFGSLFALPGSPYSLGAGSTDGQGIAVDPAGQFVFATSQLGVSIFQVLSPDGHLSLLVPPPGNAGISPMGIAAVPGAKFLYSVDFGSGPGASGQVFGFSAANAGLGLTPLPGTPRAAGANPVWIGVTPSGKFAYIAGGAPASGQILGFTINADGSLTPVSGAFASPPNPVQLVIDPGGQFLYTANPASVGVGSAVADSVAGFTIDPNTGFLTRISGSPFSVTSPGGLAIAKP